MRRRAAAGAMLSIWLAPYAPCAGAQTVTLNGSIGERAALLVIDGKPRTLRVGETHDGVKLTAVGRDEAQIELQGKRLPLRIGTPVSVQRGGASAASASREIVLAAGSGGHYLTPGQINGKTVRFLVDTGATTVALSAADAMRIGIDLRSGQRGLSATANGVVQTVRVSLASVRIQGVEVYDVQASVVPNDMPYVLLGNSFLSRFQLKVENDTMSLMKKR